jgi:hypothetical protein
MSRTVDNGKNGVPDLASVAEAVRGVLARHNSDDLSIAVEDDGVRRGDDWWYVAVRPSRRIEKVTSYYELLAEVEEEVDETTGLNVLLVPTFPEE